MTRAIEVLRRAVEVVQPPRRVPVSEAVEQSLIISEPGGYQGPFTLDVAPYMREPMDNLSSRLYEGVVFVGPARSLKTQSLVDGGLTYAITCDPGDALVVQMSRESARDYSLTRIDRAIRYSPELGRRLARGKSNDNIHDKFFVNGMMLKIGWPAITQLSSKSIRWVFLTDYDRLPDDIEGEGEPWALALKRTQTFLSRGMCCAESSPGREISDPDWKPATPHEAPPCGGIVGLYNIGDRRRWYWPCPECGEYSEPKPGIESFPVRPFDELKETIRQIDIMQAAEEAAFYVCPHCGALIAEQHKKTMNRAGRWLSEGQSIDRHGTITGAGRRSKIASYWLGGIPAAFQGWRSLLQHYYQAVLNHVTTGDEEALKTTTNVDQGAPYLPRRAHSVRSADALLTRREEVIKHHVPEGVRFLVAAIDVQAGGRPRFVVQVHGYGVDGEEWVIDRYNIRQSWRVDEDGERLPIDPAAYLEDWDVITSEVISKAYPIDDERALLPALVLCDSGGKAGVTERAYEYYRKIKRDGLAGRFQLVKGASTATAPRVQIRHPDAQRNDRKAKARGEIPVLFINTNLLKDAVDAAIQREIPGAGYIHFPDWLGDWFFNELTFEVRRDGKWSKPAKGDNEAFDLCGYARAGAIHAGIERINWDNPPLFAAEWDRNTNIRSTENVQIIQPRPVTRKKRRVRMRMYRG